MKEFLRNATKSALTYGAVGALLALSAPYLGAVVGIEAATLGSATNPLWQGVFFASFGVFVEAVSPIVLSVVTGLFGKSREQSDAYVPVPVMSPAFEYHKQVSPVLTHAASPSSTLTVGAHAGNIAAEHVMAAQESSSHFQDRFAKKREESRHLDAAVSL